VGRLGLTLTAYHAPPPQLLYTNPLAPLVLASVDGLAVARSGAPSLGELLRRQTVSALSCSSAPLPLFLDRSLARPSRRVPRPRRSAFVGLGGEVGELTEQLVAARTL
jgi:hypothetical protein